jgi:GAF domain-containing protein
MLLSMTPAAAQAITRLQHFARLRESGLLCHESFIAEALPVIADGAGCDRVSLWMYGAPTARERILQCRGLWMAGSAAADLPPLVESDHPAYFAELDRHGVLRAPEAQSHPALASMRDTYLVPNDVRSLLAVPFAVNGRRIGLLCAEQTGRALGWPKAHVAFMRRAAVTGSLLFHHLAEDEARAPPAD